MISFKIRWLNQISIFACFPVKFCSHRVTVVLYRLWTVAYCISSCKSAFWLGLLWKVLFFWTSDIFISGPSLSQHQAVFFENYAQYHEDSSFNNYWGKFWCFHSIGPGALNIIAHFTSSHILCEYTCHSSWYVSLAAQWPNLSLHKVTAIESQPFDIIVLTRIGENCFCFLVVHRCHLQD